MLKTDGNLMMKKILLFFAACWLSASSFAANVEIDRSWYLAGEPMKIEVSFEDAFIAYAELCNSNSLAAGTMVQLQGGKGSGILELPADIPSGYYVLNVYARGNNKVESKLVPVVNLLHKNQEDNIKWEKIETGDSLSYPVMLKANGEPCSLFNVQRSLSSTLNVKEIEGHIVQVHIKNVCEDVTFKAHQIRPSLGIVGKQIHYFEGKMINDTTALIYTFGLQGKHPIVLSAITETGVHLPIQMMSPYAAMLPKELPSLAFHYQRNEVEKRSREMQLHQMAITPEKRETTIGEYNDSTTEEVVPLPYDAKIFAKAPDQSYNLDEYRQFHALREVITEYVTEVLRSNANNMERFVVLGEDAGHDMRPAMVFMDGMPVYDLEKLQNYDSRRVHYINIYYGDYTFGNTIYKGIVSFVSRSGRLTNYPTESNTQYLVYEFPK